MQEKILQHIEISRDEQKMHWGKILLEQIWSLGKFSGFSFCLSEQILEIYLCLIFYPLTGVSIAESIVLLCIIMKMKTISIFYPKKSHNFLKSN